jgi:hypothetical protein
MVVRNVSAMAENSCDGFSMMAGINGLLFL